MLTLGKGRKTKSEEHSTILTFIFLNCVKRKTIRLHLQPNSATSTPNINYWKT